jgi:hypothetical protein
MVATAERPYKKAKVAEMGDMVDWKRGVGWSEVGGGLCGFCWSLKNRLLETEH